MKNAIAAHFLTALEQLKASDLPELELPEQVAIERPRDPSHGDFACNIAMVLAKKAGMPPRQLAERIVATIGTPAPISELAIAGPGFINIRLSAGESQKLALTILEAGEQYGRNNSGKGERVIVEFVSANPTGPLHVGHGRLAAYGACVAGLLEATGHEVHREYYVNDAGRQMNILAISVWLRYLQIGQPDLPFPDNGYRGEYIRDIAADLHKAHGDRFIVDAAELAAGLPADEHAGGDKDAYVDAVTDKAQALLGKDNWDVVFAAGLDAILADIRDDLEGFGVHMDRYFSERSLADADTVNTTLTKLEAAGHTYRKDGAVWFRSSDFGDEKDRVLVRANGQQTYVTPDLAYHFNKCERGFGKLIDVLGADHHGYVARVRAGLEALGQAPDCLEVRLMQFVALFRGGEKVAMTTRGGQFITLRELRAEVGNDAARFFYVLRSNDQHLDFDLELAKSRQEENPVYYIQYAHARICSVFAELEKRDLEWTLEAARPVIDQLSTSQEAALLTSLARYPEVVALAARDRAPQTLVHFLRDLTSDFHTFYNACKVLGDDAALRNARLALCAATRQVIANGLGLLGVSAPERM